MPTWFILVLPAIGACLTFLWWQYRNQKMKGLSGQIEECINYYPKTQHALKAFIIALACCGLSLVSLGIGLHHGMYDLTISVTSALYSIEHSPSSDLVIDPKPGDILIFYKFGCPDCEAVYDELVNLYTESDDVYYVSTKGLTGPRLVQEYTIQEVPSAVYIYTNEDKYVVKVLYTEDDDGNTVFDSEAWERILQLKEEGR